MRRWQSVLATMLIVALTTTMLVGCTGTDSPTDSGDSAGEVVTVRFSYPPYGYDSEAENAFWKKHIAAFEAENPGIKIEQTVESWDNVMTKWEEAVASGDVPDLAYNSPMSTIGFALRGELLPVTDVIEDLGGESVFTSPSLYFKNDGEWWGVPNCDSSVVLAYRKDLLSAAGYDAPPQDWDELVEIAQATTDESKGVYGLGIYTGDSVLTNQILGCFMEQSGGHMLNDQGEVDIDTPENVRAMQFMVDLQTKYKVVTPSANDWKYGDDANVLGTGKIAMDFMWGGYGTLVESMFPEDFEQIGFASLPTGPSGHSGSSSGTGGFIMFKGAQHPEEAKMFIKYMSQPEVQKEFCLASGNVSPFVAVADDPDLTANEWYSAMAAQAPTAVTPGWSYGITPGMDIVDNTNVFARAYVAVCEGNMTAAEAVKSIHDQVTEIKATAEAQSEQ